MLKRFSNNFSLVIAFISLALSLVLYFINTKTTAEICRAAEKNLALKEKQSQNALQIFQKKLSSSYLRFSDELLQDKNYLDCEGIVLLAYRNDSLKLWSSNLAAMDVPVQSLHQKNGMIHLRNGWFEYFTEENNTIKSVALLLIKPEYEVQNIFFNNNFVSWLKLPEQSEIRFPPLYKQHSVQSSSGQTLFEVVSKENTLHSSFFLTHLSVILFFFTLVILIFFFIRTIFKRDISTKQFLAISIGLVLIRFLMIFFKQPAVLYNSDLYNLGIYGITQSFFNEYLGDVLINVLVFFAWVTIFYKKTNLNLIPKTLKIPFSIVYFFALIALALQLNYTVKNLVINSTISLDFSNFFNLSYLSFLCLGIVFINGFSITILIEKIISFLFSTNKKEALVFLLSILSVFSAVYFIGAKSEFSTVEWFWLPILMAISVLFRKYDFTQSILSAGFRLLIFAIITSWIFGEYNQLSTEQNLKHLSEQLSDKQDAILESEFIKISRQIKKDHQLLKAIKRMPYQSIETEQQLRQIYFTRYFEKYNIQISIFDSLCMPFLKNSDYKLNNREYFDDQLKAAIPTISDELYFIEKHKNNARYIGKIEFSQPKHGKSPYTIYVQLEPKKFTDSGNFPELLLDKSQQKQNSDKALSYAIYKNGNLNSVFGKYIYPKFFTASVFSQNTDHFKHQLFIPDKETQLVVSSRTKGFAHYFTANSYYFLFYSLLGVLFFFLNHQLSSSSGSFFTLNRRIQFFIVSVLFLSLLAVGIFTINLVVNKSGEEQSKLLTEKARQIQNELSNKLFFNQRIDINSKPFTENVLKEYAELFNSDISLYNENGVLFASSRPQLFTSGISSKLINPLVPVHFDENNAMYFITHDKIGSLNYISVYTAVYNAHKKLTGYINLPYFARQNDMEEGVSDYITTLINIYVVLFLVSLFTGLVISVYITKPLRILQEQLAKISLANKNEPITWKSEDEIGRLVNEYNMMLLKLEESALLLAKSEREGAWQEMAKQVAHEIKNPLTPMKLNLQYLQKVVGEEGVDFPERFKKVSDSLIEQIDTLAHIANEFSNFAKMPKVNLEKINLAEVINSTIALFSNQSNISINLKLNDQETFVNADKNQSLRVFNNLLKNSIQALQNTPDGVIEITISSAENTVLVSVHDNGVGIPEYMKDKIFVPNFTTKTTGTGLGLAMVKNIMTSFNGEIWFESTENEGTTFYLKFQKIK